METEDTQPEKRKSLKNTLSELPASIRELIPDSEENLEYYERTNEMHCNIEKAGGSKFLDAGNIFEVIGKDGNRIADAVKQRIDDREFLLEAGASESAFLPSIKNGGDPEGLPEALYYKVEGIKGKLGVEKLSNLEPDTKVLVRREKSFKDENGKEKVPCSFTVVKGEFEDMPDTDFATVIIGREGGESGRDELWTIHPGMPVKAAQGDIIPGSENLPGPQGVEEGEKQSIMVTTIGELLENGWMKEDDYIKVVPGNLDEVIKEYKVIE